MCWCCCWCYKCQINRNFADSVRRYVAASHKSAVVVGRWRLGRSARFFSLPTMKLEPSLLKYFNFALEIQDKFVLNSHPVDFRLWLLATECDDRLLTELGLEAPPVCEELPYCGKLICCFGLVPSPYPTEICRLELVELTEIVGLVRQVLIESHVDERERSVIGESPMKLGGRDVRFWAFSLIMCEWEKEITRKKEREKNRSRAGRRCKKDGKKLRGKMKPIVENNPLAGEARRYQM